MSDKPMPVTILEWRPFNRGKMRGFAKVGVGSLQINDVTILVMDDGRVWAKLPDRPLLDREGQPMRDENNNPRRAPVMQWASRDASERFSAGVTIALKQFAPDVDL
jgi:hypothetical protein